MIVVSEESVPGSELLFPFRGTLSYYPPSFLLLFLLRFTFVFPCSYRLFFNGF